MQLTPAYAGVLLTLVEGAGDLALKKYAIGGASWLYAFGTGIYILLASILVWLFKHLGFAITNAYWDATSNLFTMGVGYLILKESYTLRQWVGMIIVSVGIYLINGNGGGGSGSGSSSS
jgi:drug/metabolite transporter (DMT)-like permease